MRLLRTRHLSPGPRMPPALKYRSTVGKGKDKKMTRSSGIKKAGGGMRLFLEQLLDDNTCKGLSWSNKTEKKFKISWHHASRHDFDTTEHANVFILYAKSTGREVLTNCGYNSKLKSNFRSALNSLPDCMEVKDARSTKGKDTGTVKIYQFIDSSHPEYQRKKESKIRNQRNSKKRRTRGAIARTDPAPTVEPAITTPVDPCGTSDPQVSLDNLIYPDEAKQFFDSNNIIEEGPCVEIGTLDSFLSEAHTFDNILHSSTTAALSDQPNVPTPSVIEVASHSASEMASSSQYTVTTIDPPSWDTEMISNLLQPPSQLPQLPNFNALGVNDSFDEPKQILCENFKSGGIVRVRKPLPDIQTMHEPATFFILEPVSQKSIAMEDDEAGNTGVFTDHCPSVTVEVQPNIGSMGENYELIQVHTDLALETILDTT